jgi:hypothetical protein
VRARRSELGLSQSDLADAAKVDRLDALFLAIFLSPRTPLLAAPCTGSKSLLAREALIGCGLSLARVGAGVVGFVKGAEMTEPKNCP